MQTPSPLLNFNNLPQFAGQCDPAFLFPDDMTLAEVQADARRPWSEAERHRLVKASKCPTALKPAETVHIPQSWIGRPEQQTAIEPTKLAGTPEGQRAAYTVLQFREWSDEYRIRTRVETTAGTTPPEQAGPRITANLSQRAARKVAESCSYVSLQKGGYRTFFTLTFDAEHRAAIDAGETSIQREVSRFMDGLQKMWRRGWKAEFTAPHGRKFYCADKRGEVMGEPGQDKELLYVWVAEAPDNEHGKPNPHVHVLINWRVKYSLFPSWAKRIESLWGQGIAHIEKIKDTDAAASYMMKAAGYLCKAQGKSDQGEIRGNRYGICAAARAPEWATLSETQLHIMGRLIADVHEHLTQRHGEDYRRRKVLAQHLEKAPKGSKTRHAVGKALQRVRRKLEKLPIVASKYQILLKGKHAFWLFLQWARTNDAGQVANWLPEKGPGEVWNPGETRPPCQWYAEFKERHYWRRALRKMPQWSDLEFTQAANDYEQYAAIAAA